MPGDSIGRLFRVTVWGESHGPAAGAVIEGCPPGIKLDHERINRALSRRKPGGKFVSARGEDDRFEILSGLFKGKTTGTPVSIIIKNTAAKSENYTELENLLRPGHGDFTYLEKYGVRDYRGGGRSSARLTAPVVAAGAIASQFLQEVRGIDILAWLKSVGNVTADIESTAISREIVQASCINFPDSEAEKNALDLMEKLRIRGDSTGGVVECRIIGVPSGLGEPLFNGLDADLGAAITGLNAVKGFEIGNGFDASLLTGSENNDEFTCENGRITLATNRCGGVLGGISTGTPLVFRAAFKPAPSISVNQNTVDIHGRPAEISVSGQHDVCVAVRAVPVVEALAAIVVMDHLLRHRGQCGVR
ncbi:chorismate synthase [Candidatus Fermentibacteria bacterium]|nr:MAG: chorismate synthase [Candidatus Fermentibacteria bacterium]